jgi:flagellar hook-basal body complex protein FliE
MDVKLTPAILSSLQKALQSGAPGGMPPVAGAGATGGVSFANALGDALKSLSHTQGDAGALQKQFQAGAEGVSLEETMVAMQKAQIGFQAALTVRNRLVSAYTDIMNMQV